MTHKARWEYVKRASSSDPIAVLMVDWFSTGKESEAVYVMQAVDVSKGSYLAVFDGHDETFRKQYYQIPSAEEMLETVMLWQSYL